MTVTTAKSDGCDELYGAWTYIHLKDNTRDEEAWGSRVIILEGHSNRIEETHLKILRENLPQIEEALR